MTLHLELAQGARSGTSYVDAPFVDGCVRLRETQRTEFLGVEGWAELNRSQYIRLGESVPCLRGLQVQLLKELCLHANCSEEFFLSVSKDQWLRTAITSEKALFSSGVKQFLSRVTIRSLVLPWHLYWPKLEAMRERGTSERVYFPSTVLEAVLSEKSSLTEQLKERLDECTIAKQWTEDEETMIRSRPFWKIALRDVKAVKGVAEGSQAAVGKVLWRGGLFARKVFNQKHVFDAELEVVRRVSHPHVVYSFGVCTMSLQHFSLLMELLDGDLALLIEDRVRRRGYSKPPFPRLVALDILLQIAKAMSHMHDSGVVHGDLKPENVLVSHCEIVGGVGQYFVKVADFGSARILSSSRFYPKGFTTQFAAPEVLHAVSEQTAVADDPKIDVYSFGILAFQILTGLVPYERVPSLGIMAAPGRGDLKKGVIAGTLRPPLREACSRPHFWNDPELLALVESCWDPQPSNRPHFPEVVDHLEKIHNNLTQKQTPVIDASRDPRIEADGHTIVVDGDANVVDVDAANVVDGDATNVVDGDATNVVDGAANVVDGAANVVDGAANVADGDAANVVDGDAAIAVDGGAANAVDGHANVADGAANVADGAANVADGAANVADGAANVADGAANVADGALQFASTTRSNGSPLPEANQVNNGAQVYPQRIMQDKPRNASRRRGSFSRYLMKWICVAPPKII